MASVAGVLHRERPESSLFLCRDAALQLFKPVQHYVDLGCRRFLLACLNHQKPLPVGADVVVGLKSKDAWLVLPVEQQFGFGRSEYRLGLDGCDHHPVAVAIEQLAPVPRPDRLNAAFG